MKLSIKPFTNFYTSQGNTIPPDNEFFHLENDTLLDSNESTSCEVLLSEKERREALKDVDPDKAPGTDGLPAEFYETFWDEFAFSLIYGDLIYAYDQGTLSVSKRREIIKLVPKKDADDLHFIKNWRPLTLLKYCDYKISTKAIGNRIKTVIPKLIKNDQTGFLKGRFLEKILD